MRLVNPSDADLQEAFAVNVAKWTFITFPTGACPNIKHWKDSGGKHVSIHMDGRWIDSADAVLPWLEKNGVVRTDYVKASANYQWRVDIFESIAGAEHAPKGWANDAMFPRAAVIALLRAHGVEIEFTQ